MDKAAFHIGRGHPDQNTSLSGFTPRPGNTFLLDLVARSSQACCIGEDDRYATDIQHDFDHVAGRTGNGRDNGGIPLCNRIEQARFAGIGQACQYDLHTATPETSGSTHYYFATRRNHIADDGDYNQMKIAAMHAAFENEDGPIIEAVQGEMDTADFFSLNPVLMTNDVAPVKVRRLLQRLIAQEATSFTPS